MITEIAEAGKIYDVDGTKIEAVLNPEKTGRDCLCKCCFGKDAFRCIFDAPDCYTNNVIFKLVESNIK